APSGGASATLSAASAITNSSGVAEISATASQVSGAYEVIASVDGVAESARFSLTNDPGPAAMIVASRSATPQSAHVNTPYTNPLSVHVLDAFGNPVPGASVTFSAPSSDPSAKLTSSPPTSGSNGEASVAAIALMKTGMFTVTAMVSGTSVMASFQLTNSAGDPVNVMISDGADQTALASQPFGAPLKVLVVDASGNPISGAKVHVSASDDGPTATLSATDLTTDANGEASIDVTANDTPGQFTLSVSVVGASIPVVANFTIAPIPTTCTVNLMPHEIATGSDADIQVMVTSDHGTPAGHVEIFVDDASVGKFYLTAGAVTYTLSDATLGDHTLRADYEAQAAFDASQSDSETLTVAAPGSFDAGSGYDGGITAADGGKPSGAHVGWKLRGGGCAIAPRALAHLPPSAARPFALLGLLGLLWIARRRRRD
ncbi:MAG TPA: Ig-like domain-containing protein, partial [Polyangiales bacterium]